MPPRRRAGSSEMGDPSYGDDLNTRTGRPIRKRRKTQQPDSPFVDSAVAVSDSEDDGVDNIDDDEDCDPVLSDDGELSVVPRGRKIRPKRRRSPSPPLSDDQDRLHEDLIPSRDNSSDESSLTPSPNNPIGSIVIKDLVIKVPPGHSGPITLRLDPSCSNGVSSIPGQPQISIYSSASNHKHGGKRCRRGSADTSIPSAQQTDPTSSTNPHPYAGFLDLPAELRIEIYRQVLVSERELSFHWPHNFSRCAALLRTCRQIHSEARRILYGENRFVFLRRSTRCGSYWETEWTDVGYKVVRRFLKSIGVVNTELLRHVALVLTDATPSLSRLRTTIDERRFVNDEILLSVLRHLGDFAKLQRLELHFHGRRRVERADSRFLEYLLDIHADEVVFTNGRNIIGSAASSPSKQDYFVEHACLEIMPRLNKLYDEHKSAKAKKASSK